MPLGLGDCEAIGTGVLAQPVNAWSSMAFVLAGLWLLVVHGDDATARWHRAMVGLAMIGAGIGSFAYHGSVGAWAQTAHDLGLAAIAIALGIVAVRRLRPIRRRHAAVGFAGLLGVSAVILTMWPDSGNAVVAATLTIASALHVGWWRRRSADWHRAVWRQYAAAGVLSVAALALQVLGRTGAPWCDPTTLLQPHAAWHVLGAIATALVATLVAQPTRAHPSVPAAGARRRQSAGSRRK